MNNSKNFILIIIGIILAEIGGIWMIKLSQKSLNPSYVKKLGKLMCILGIIALVMCIFGILVDTWS